MKIYGQHDERTVEQLARCADAQPDTKSVLCADGHLGHSMPIGGVVAYKNHVSPSGVGFDIGCFSGDTRIFTLDGKNPTLAEVAGRDVFVLASTDYGTPMPTVATCLLTRRNARLVNVELDNGARVRCTPDHLFMCRDGTYKAASDLVAGQSLMPLYVAADKDGYVLVRNSATKRLLRLHWMVYRAGLTECSPELNGDQLVLHHRDFDPTNNDPSNLVPMSKTAHDAYHAACRDRAHLNTPEFTANRLEAIQRFWETAREDEGFMQKRAEMARRNSIAAPAIARSERCAANGERGKDYLIRYNRGVADGSIPKAGRSRAGAESPCAVCGVVLRGTSSLYYHTKREHADNHKVVGVHEVETPEDVYCLSVPGFNNFALSAGVFVHNCGNMAVKTNVVYADVAPDAQRIADQIHKRLSFGMGVPAQDIVQDHDVYARISANADVRHLYQTARNQLGTVGSGNHYVDVFEDGEGYLWIGCHFGSRGFGHKVATGFLNLAHGRSFDAHGGDDSMDAPPTLISMDTALGEAYFEAMEIAGAYAYAGRARVVELVREIIGLTTITDAIHNHHNFTWRETHDGETYYVVRKGATPAGPGQRGFVGGSMGDVSVILHGVESDASRDALYSTVHGAGRVMSRRRAAGKTRMVSKWCCRNYRKCDFQGDKGGFRKDKDGPTPVCPNCGHKLDLRRLTTVISKGEVDFEQAKITVRDYGVILRGAGADEAPQCYRRLQSVLDAHAGTIAIETVLQPRIVVMAGEEVEDSYRD